MCYLQKLKSSKNAKLKLNVNFRPFVLKHQIKRFAVSNITATIQYVTSTDAYHKSEPPLSVSSLSLLSGFGKISV